MKVSYNWLKQYIDFEWTPEELCEKLTGTGLEVEGLERFESIPGALEGVVVGEVLSAVQHPNADRLKVCKVNVGQEEALQIVCGAPNVAAGQKVPVALVGCKLYPLNGEPFEIKKSKIRGEESQGMICAEDELGMGESHDGIIVFEDSVMVGQPVGTIYGIEMDYTIEIGLTANRSDATSHFGVCRDLGALLKKPLRLPEIHQALKAPTLENPISIHLENEALCPLYAGLYIQGVSIQESPKWLKNRLKAIGARPINNIVDSTNYVLHELGHPLHAFDADLISGNTIVVKTLKKNLEYTTLDEEKRQLLANEDLMICDGKGPVAIAGIMGGLGSSVNEKTTNIFLESAWFDPAAIRKTAKRLGMKTDASYRFERSADPHQVEPALLRAASLILELAGGRPSKLTTVSLREFPDTLISFNLERANRMMGKAFSEAEILDILKYLDIHKAKGSQSVEPGCILLAVPPYRVDVTRPQDIMEEILRIYGYNNIGFDNLSKFRMSFGNQTEARRTRERYFNALAGSGWNEILTNSLVRNNLPGDHSVTLLNNLSEDLAVMRSNLLFTGLEVVEYNHNRKMTNLKLVDFGKVYSLENDKYLESERVGMLLTGNSSPDHWAVKPRKSSFFTLAREMERLQAWFGFEGQLSDLEDHPLFEYGMELCRGNTPIAKFGKVKAAHLKGRDIKGEVFYAEIEWAPLLKIARKSSLTFQELPKFPSLERDVSLLVPDSLKFSDVAEAIRKTSAKLIKEVRIGDVYKGEKIAPGKKSYLISIEMRDEAKSMTSHLADKIMEEVYKLLQDKFGAEVRGL